MLLLLWQDQLIRKVLKSCPQIRPVFLPASDKIRQLGKLGSPDRRLHIRSLQVVAYMGVHIFVVIASGKSSELSVKAVAAQIVHPSRAAALPSPVPHRTKDLVKQRVGGVDRSPFPQIFCREVE